MSIIIDHVELDLTNKEFNYAVQLVEAGIPLIYLTGKAGTGKTFFLKYIRETSHKNKVILAPTGIASINAGGQTINSFFQLPFLPFHPDDNRLSGSEFFDTFQYNSVKRTIIENLDLLIIDEVSMVRCDTLDVIDLILKKIRQSSKPFGGVQMILIGDAFQLPPVLRRDSNEWNILKQVYDNRFFFDSKIFQKFLGTKEHAIVELKKIYSQKEQDFIDVLNSIRINEVLDSDIEILNNKYSPILPPTIDNYIILSTRNRDVNHINASKLGELKDEKKFYEGNLIGEFPKDKYGEYILPTNFVLELKEGAQVMMLKNATDYHNGSIGKIRSLLDEQIIIDFPKNENVIIEKASWFNIEYSWNSEHRRVIEIPKGTFTQFPLKLAWAITVHKSQGLRFDKVVADVGNAFEAGQVYVALSRCTSLNGLILKSIIPRNAIFADPHVVEFSRHVTPETLIVEKINSGKADSLYKKARQALKGLQYDEAFEYLLEAIKARNDTETAGFKRFIVTTLKRFVSLRKGINDLATVQSLEEALSFLSEENKLLRDEKLKHTLKIEQQNQSIKTLLDKVQEMEIFNAELKSMINEKALYVTSQKDQIDDLTVEVESQQLIIKQLNDSRDLYLNEIELLKKRKWYQLF